MADETPTGRRMVTEAANPRTADLDRLPIGELVLRIIDEDAQVSAAVRAARPALELATLALVEALDAGGRWFNVGAGTSGRIGALDAAEIPPTFGLPPERVQALVAGGPAALVGPVEGAEDDVSSAPRELDKLKLGPGDAVVALSASGRTPFALVGARARAPARGARDRDHLRARLTARQGGRDRDRRGRRPRGDRGLDPHEGRARAEDDPAHALDGGHGAARARPGESDDGPAAR